MCHRSPSPLDSSRQLCIPPGQLPYKRHDEAAMASTREPRPRRQGGRRSEGPLGGASTACKLMVRLPPSQLCPVQTRVATPTRRRGWLARRRRRPSNKRCERNRQIRRHMSPRDLGRGAGRRLPGCHAGEASSSPGADVLAGDKVADPGRISWLIAPS